jgi:hypothetical protein
MKNIPNGHSEDSTGIPADDQESASCFACCNLQVLDRSGCQVQSFFIERFARYTNEAQLAGTGSKKNHCPAVTGTDE